MLGYEQSHEREKDYNDYLGLCDFSLYKSPIPEIP